MATRLELIAFDKSRQSAGVAGGAEPAAGAGPQLERKLSGVVGAGLKVGSSGGNNNIVEIKMNVYIQCSSNKLPLTRNSLLRLQRLVC